MRKSVAIMAHFLSTFFLCCLVLILWASPTVSYASQEFTVQTDEGDAVSILGDLKINNKTSGSVVIILGNADISADVEGDVVAVLGKINLDAGVSGDVVNILGKITLTGNAAVGGDFVSIGTTQKAQGVKLNGQQVEINTSALRFARAFITILFAFFTLILGLVVIANSKNRLKRLASVLENNISKKVLIGFIGFLGASILALLLGITIVAPVIYLLLLLLTEITAGIYFGRQILKVFDLRLSTYMEFVFGLLFITLVKIAFTLVISRYDLVAYLILYSLFSMFIYSLGLGILLDTRFGSDVRSVKAVGGNFDPKSESGMNNDTLDKDLKTGGDPDENK